MCVICTVFFFLLAQFGKAFGVSIHHKKASFLKPHYASLVINADSGALLSAHEANSLRHPASLTKMMTLYMVFKALKERRISLRTALSISSHAARQAPSKLGIPVGKYILVKDAIASLITKSANDIAAAIGEHLSGTESAFAQAMTCEARRLGMTHSIFVNASGLPDARQVTTARDMATLSRALYKEFPDFFPLFSLKSFNYKGANHKNHNHLLGKVNGVDGIKTGYTVASGFNLAASAVRHNAMGHPVRLIVIVLGGKNRIWRDNKVTEMLEIHYNQLGCPASLPKVLSITNHVTETALPSLTPLVHHVQNKNRFSKKKSANKKRLQGSASKTVYRGLNQLIADYTQYK